MVDNNEFEILFLLKGTKIFGSGSLAKYREMYHNSDWNKSLEVSLFNLLLKSRPKFKVTLSCSGFCALELKVSPVNEIPQPLWATLFGT